jgi:uncharacterized repeat protein (TIGR03803 family)
MTRCGEQIGSILFSTPRTISIAMALICAAAAFTAEQAQAQTFTVLYAFTGAQKDGGVPVGGLTRDAAGNLFGTTTDNFSGCCGDAFQLSNRGSGWAFTNINDFLGFSAADPAAPLLVGPNGILYGTAMFAGFCDGQNGACGAVYSLQRPPTAVCSSFACHWTATLLYQFRGVPSDGDHPGTANLAMDLSGNLYGVTQEDGSNFSGVVYELTPSGSGWSESILWNFPEMNPANNSGLVLDRSGNLYGETLQGIYELKPTGSGWIETTLHSFQPQDGTHPYGGLILDQAGNLYGTTSQSGPNGGGTVFKLTPSNGQWTLTVLYAFSGPQGPHARLTMDAVGNLYGTNYENGAHFAGSVFKLTRTGNGWTYTDLYDFTGGDDGALPVGNIVVDPSGNIFGTTSQGGPHECPGVPPTPHCGVVWEITP